jgi:hypothetical protein
MERDTDKHRRTIRDTGRRPYSREFKMRRGYPAPCLIRDGKKYMFFDEYSGPGKSDKYGINAIQISSRRSGVGIKAILGKGKLSGYANR